MLALYAMSTLLFGRLLAAGFTFFQVQVVPWGLKASSLAMFSKCLTVQMPGCFLTIIKYLSCPESTFDLGVFSLLADCRQNCYLGRQTVDVLDCATPKSIKSTPKWHQSDPHIAVVSPQHRHCGGVRWPVWSLRLFCLGGFPIRATESGQRSQSCQVIHFFLSC